MGSLIFAVVFFIFVVLTIAKGVRIVPQGSEWVVERLGKFRTTLSPGLHILVPYIDDVAYKVSTKDIILEIPSQEVITKDNAVLTCNAIAFIKVTDTQNAVYGIENFQLAASNIVQTTLRAILGGMELDEALSKRDQIKAQLKLSIADEVGDWGLTVKSVEIQDLTPSVSMVTAMEQQAAAERSRKAMVTQAEGHKSSAILEAEGKLEASKREAEAQVALAYGAAKAIQQITLALGDKEFPAYFLLGERYINAMKDLAASDNSKTVVLPADIFSAIQGLVGKR